MTRKTILTLIFTCFTIAAMAAEIQLRVVTENRNGRDSATVFMNYEVMARFYGEEKEIGGPEERAKMFAARLMQLAAMGVKPDDPRFFAGIKDEFTIIEYSPNLICTIVEAETTVNKTNDVYLAQEWLKNIKIFLSKMPKDDKIEEKPEDNFPMDGMAIRYDPLIKSKDFIVTHKSLPIGSKLRIVNPRNKWSLIALVSENTPPSASAAVGLASNTAEALGITTYKPVLVRLEMIQQY
ncbi:MAG: hypothetical protein WC838_01225 [Candidatus Margulisiibacteriota bacterium]|jgi:hypothetical protein